jgi:cytidylate kinase
MIMNKNEKYVITINRELGSGGRTVGLKLAEKLGVQFYDKAVVKAIEEKYNLNVEEIEKLKGKKHNWWSDLKRVVSVGGGIMGVPYYSVSEGEVTVKTTTDEMFKTETQILKGIAEEESCVLAGRSGFFVFRDHPNHLSILIQASMESRIKRLMGKQNISEAEIRKTINKVDEMRENYVNRYTGTSRYDTRNYDIVLRADGKTEDELVDIIMQYIG